MKQKNWLRRWNGSAVECHEMNKGKVPPGTFPWLCVGDKLGAQIVVQVGDLGWQVGCQISDLVDFAKIDADDDDPDERIAFLLALAESFEREAEKLRGWITSEPER